MKKIIIMFFVSMPMWAYSQTHLGDTWEMGLYGYHVNTSTTNLVHDTLSKYFLTFSHGVSNICDSTGEMLYMSDGMNIYNKQGNLIDGGDTLASTNYYNFNLGYNVYQQANIFLPMDSGKIYFITPSCNDTNLANVWQNGTSQKAPFNVLWYNVIDKYANAGAGKVIQQMQPVLENKELSRVQMMACKHANGKDWWLLKMAADSNNIYIFKVTQDSIYYNDIQRMPFYGKTYYDLWGQMMISRDGTKFATTSTSNLGILYTADFDRCHGLLSNFKKIVVPYNTWQEGVDSTTSGVAFSPNGRFIYVSSFSNILQYDTQDSTWYKVAGLDTVHQYFCGYMNLGLANNNKIYVGSFHGTCKNMSAIDNPDVKGVGCNFCKKCVQAQSVYGYLVNVPCMPNYDLGATPDTCLPLSINNEQLIMNNELLVYPNPASTKLYVSSWRGTPAKSYSRKQSRYELYNSVGQLIFSTTKNEIDVSRFAKGVYYLKCDGVSKKVVIQ